MKDLSECVLYTHEPSLLQRITRLLALRAKVRHIDDPDALIYWAAQHSESVVLLDARVEHYNQLLKELLQQGSPPVLMVMGVERSDPLRFAESMGVYAVLPLEPQLEPFHLLMRHAEEQAALIRQNRHLKEELAQFRMVQSEQIQRQPTRPSMLPLRNFSRTLKNFDDISQLYKSVMDSFFESAKVARAGLFCSVGGSGYCYRAGVHCLPQTKELSFSGRDRFVHWLNLNGFMVSRQTVRNLADPVDRDMLQHYLELFGAELIIPIHAGDMVNGWIFVGQRITGVPFEYEDLDVLTAYADHIANTLWNAFKHQQTSLQKVLAETVLHVIPCGLVAIDVDGAIRWINQEAAGILERDRKEVIGMRSERLNSQVTDVLRRALAGTEVRPPVEWLDPVTRKLLSIESRRLISETNECVGAVALIEDVTQQRLLEEKEEQLERAAFWSELAASLSHEVRNPLVTIKTFAQLLPWRYDDAEFRTEFSLNVVAEVDRLTGLVEQIYQFAHPPTLKFSPVKIQQIIDQAVSDAQKMFRQEITVISRIDPTVPMIEGDEIALSESLLHLLMNCAESLVEVAVPQIEIIADIHYGIEGRKILRLRVLDNGSGLPIDTPALAFSPFYTTKACGMGLGLSIVKRTALDHNGSVDLSNVGSGFQVTMNIPVSRG